MEYKKEEIIYNKEFPYLVFSTRGRQMYLHSHDVLEINYVKSGKGYYIIEDREYMIEESDIYIINHLEPHMAVHDGTLEIQVIVFDPSVLWQGDQGMQLLEPFFSRDTGFDNCIKKQEKGHERLTEILKCISQEYDGKEAGWELFVRAQTQLFMAQLYRMRRESNNKTEPGRHKLWNKLQPVLQYIHSHYHEPIGLDELSEAAMMSRSYLCTCFKNYFHIRIFEYIDRLRIENACLLLSSTEDSITEIALESGFGSVSYFNRIFKKAVGMSPGDYRKSKYSTNKF
ncbi:AraC family transcriptional regulator [Lachnospiraceae bacterium OttesenSCG-928-D06]|nr:AraC family transcriptional regulator [Lachnospiraceae bacterium OttesenSCG-928-D06]